MKILSDMVRLGYATDSLCDNLTDFMSNLMIVSDVDASFMSPGMSFLDRNGLVNMFDFEKGFMFRIPNDLQIILRNRIKEWIEDQLVRFVPTSSRILTEFEYEGQIVQLNLRNKIEWHLGEQIGFYSMLKRSLVCEGNIYLINSQYLDKLGIDRILFGIQKSREFSDWKQLQEIMASSPLKLVYEKDVLIQAISKLYDLGLIAFDEMQRKYVLTGRGFVYR